MTFGEMVRNSPRLQQNYVPAHTNGYREKVTSSDVIISANIARNAEQLAF